MILLMTPLQRDVAGHERIDPAACPIIAEIPGPSLEKWKQLHGYPRIQHAYAMLMGKIWKALRAIQCLNERTLPLIEAQPSLRIAVPDKSAFASALKNKIDPASAAVFKHGQWAG
jgi:hypothetical protein